MRILCTFPGKHGDLLWALPTIRAISESLGDIPIDLLIAGQYAGLVPLLAQQPYLRTVDADPDWIVQDTAPMTPRVPPGAESLIVRTVTPPELSPSYDQVFHLGYRGWPEAPLPYETYACLQAQWPTSWPSLQPLDLDRPWITVDPMTKPFPFALGWTEEHFELKVGLTALFLQRPQDPTDLINLSWSPRWHAEWWQDLTTPRPLLSMLQSWRAVARILAGAQVFCGDCSALHVLACALGIPTVIMEPNPHRHHEIFYPYGTDGRRVHLVRGMDGLPTFDARHTWEAIQAALQE